jgi:hypothetical protein
MPKNRSIQESSVYNRFAVQCSRNRTCRIFGKAELWDIAGLLSERNPVLTLKKALSRVVTFLQTLDASMDAMKMH